jgi:hypothetical protein
MYLSEKTDAASKTANATSVEIRLVAASVFTHALRGTFCTPPDAHRCPVLLTGIVFQCKAVTPPFLMLEHQHHMNALDESRLLLNPPMEIEQVIYPSMSQQQSQGWSLKWNE